MSHPSWLLTTLKLDFLDLRKTAAIPLFCIIFLANQVLAERYFHWQFKSIEFGSKCCLVFAGGQDLWCPVSQEGWSSPSPICWSSSCVSSYWTDWTVTLLFSQDYSDKDGCDGILRWLLMKIKKQCLVFVCRKTWSLKFHQSLLIQAISLIVRLLVQNEEEVVNSCQEPGGCG